MARSKPKETRKSKFSVNDAAKLDTSTGFEAILSADDENYDLSSRLYKAEERYGTREFIARLARGDVQLYREVQWWQKRHGIGDREVAAGLARVLDGAVDVDTEGLTPEQRKRLSRSLKQNQALPLDKLIDKLKYCDV